MRVHADRRPVPDDIGLVIERERSRGLAVIDGVHENGYVVPREMYDQIEPGRAEVDYVDVLGELITRFDQAGGERTDAIVAHQDVADPADENSARRSVAVGGRALFRGCVGDGPRKVHSTFTVA